MSTTTTNYSFILPGVNDPTDQDLWGGYLNSNWTSIDSLLKLASNTTTSTKTTAYTITTADLNKLILGDATSASFTITLPPAATAANGFVVSVQKIDASANTVTLDGDGAETINGAANYVLTDQYQYVTVVCNGTSWTIVASTPEQIAFADNATSNTGTSTVTALTPANFGTQNSLASDGYQKLPGGLILQWGEDTVGPEPATTTITYPIAFPTAIYSITTSTQIANTGGLDDNHNFVQVYGDPTLTQFVAKNQQTNGGNVSITVRWMAIGK